MEPWAVTVPEARRVPPVVPKRRKPLVLRWLVVLVVALVATTTVGVVARRSSTVALGAVDRPSGAQLPLTLPFTAVNPVDGNSFQIDLPAQDRPMVGVNSVQSDGGSYLVIAELGGTRRGFLQLIRFGDHFGNSPEESLAKTDDSGLTKRIGSVRRTAVGGHVAYVVEFAVGRLRIREFRFMRDGAQYGFNISYYPEDTVSLDTGLAALATLRWVA